MSTEPDQDLLDLELQADAYVAKVREAAREAVPILLKLKKEQFLRSDPQLRALVLGTHDAEGQVKQAVRNILQNAVRGVL